MEINVTALVTDGDMFDFSASQAERGMSAANETWHNAKTEAAERPLLTDEQLPDFRKYAEGFGAWEREIIDAWNATECNALFVQMVAGDVREAQGVAAGDGPGDIDWEAYGAQDSVGGRLYLGDDGKIYYYVGD